MSDYSERDLEEQKNALLALFSAEEIQIYHSILEESCYLDNYQNTIIGIKTEVGTDGK